MKRESKIRGLLSLGAASVTALSVVVSPAIAKAATPTTITWWLPGQEPKDYAQVMAKLNPILEKDINVQLQLKFADYGDYNNKMNVIISSGTPYDIAFTASWANNLNLQVGKGAFLSLDDLLNKYGQGLKQLIPSNIWKASTINGKIYAVPTYKDSGAGDFFLFSKQLATAAKFNYQAANTLQSLAPYLKYVKEHDKNVIPYPIQGTASILQYPFDYLNGPNFPLAIQFTDKTETVVNPFTTTIMKKNLATLHQYYEAGYINKDAAVATTGPKFVPVTTANGWPAAATIWSTQFGYPVVVSQAYPNYLSTSSIQGSMNAISASSPNAIAAMKLLNLVNTNAQVRNLLAYGVQGLNYVKTGPTSIKQSNTDWSPANFALGTFYDGMYTVDPAPKNEWTNLKTFESKALPSPALGFQLDLSNPQMQTQVALIQNVYNKYANQICSGTADPATAVPQMNAALNAAGLPKLISEVQQQVNAWKASSKK